MENDIKEGKVNKSTNMEESGKTTKKSDKTTTESININQKKLSKNNGEEFIEPTRANVYCDNSVTSKTPSKVKTRNKNTFLRKSKSCLEMKSTEEETLPHSKSFSGKPLHFCSSQMSIPECDGDNSNQIVQCNISLTTTERNTQSSDKNDDLTNTENNSEVHTSDSSSNLQLFGNQHNTSHQSEQDGKLQLQPHHYQNQQQQENQQQQLKHQTHQQLSKQQPLQPELEQNKQQIIQQNLPQKVPQLVLNDLRKEQQHKKSHLLLANTGTAPTSTETEAISTSTIITSTTITTSSTEIVATSSVAVTLKQQVQPLSPLHPKQSEKGHMSTRGFHSPFSPPTPNVCDYSTWLPQKWQGIKVEQFHDDQLSLNQPEAKETNTNISTEAGLTDDGLTNGKQAEPKTVVRKAPTGTTCISEMSRSIVPCNNQSRSVTTSSSAPAATTDFEASAPQKTTPTFNLNDLGSREIPISRELSIIENSSVSSASPDVDYVSIQYSASSPQLSSMQSSATLSSLSSMSSIESSTLPSNSSNSSLGSSALPRLSSVQTSRPSARILPTLSSSGSISKKEKRKDFILLNAEADQEEAEQCRDHLKTDIGIPDLTIDLFCEIDSGQTAMMSLETLHDRYNNILILGTKNLEGDKYSRFLNENLLTTGLQDANGKEDRVIPVWTSKDCKGKITEFRIIKGFEYYSFLSDKSSTRATCYIQCVKNTVKEGRKNSR
ncbi:uncharacterized protein LOC128552781 [Mercenaria mercenaria]|uniref:uncharacterized protein LOC128552781 n=1 Tax=Mercenaria mercenaria TaxID=6596 RepID=UPI00234E574F|nr:uncharacterized protein LOC128552781 [Mercenaria mercenaria]XP_053389820.1 uncharacterized protein LOC128552781 [Mercenaria mercenaria]